MDDVTPPLPESSPVPDPEPRPASESASDGEDPFGWLEDVTGDVALDWVRARNAEVLDRYTGTELFAAVRDEIRAVLDADTRIPYVVRRGEHLYNLWQDADHPRGLWRRTTLPEYRTDAPAWETVLDVDALAEAEGENWVWHGATFLRPGYGRCLVSLSRGGADADVVREFDPSTRQFVPAAEGGFTVPEAKTFAGWVDVDTLYVGTDFGPGSLTDAGYPRTVRRWRRGTPLAEAETVFEGEAGDVLVTAWRDHTSGHHLLDRSLTFYRSLRYVLPPGADGWTPLEVPEDARVSVHGQWLLVETRTDWTVGGVTHPAGALLVTGLASFLAGDRRFDVLFHPNDRSALLSHHWTRSALVVASLVDVRTRLAVHAPAPDGRWRPLPAPEVPTGYSATVVSTDPDHDDEYLLALDGFLEPPTLRRAIAGQPDTEVLKRAPTWFDAAGLTVTQHRATSADGTAVPYFLISPEDPAGPVPTLLNGYGGFEVPLLPGYDGGLGRAWLARGGAYAVANLRGGGEYGPRWHQAALGRHRHRVYEDFAAVAADLVARGLTTPARLGANGGSNGGLLIGNMLTGHPERFGALVAQVPLFDMRRYHRLLAGSSWMAEYGDPDDPEHWEYLRRYSPYHQLRPYAAPDDPDAPGRRYPPTLVTTSTRDDRVHPGHARKLVARMRDLGHPADRIRYYENIEGGHGGAATNEQRAFVRALVFTFLWDVLGGD